MTTPTLREAVQAAVDLHGHIGEPLFAGGGWPMVDSMNAVTAALRAALAAPSVPSGEPPLFRQYVDQQVTKDMAPLYAAFAAPQPVPPDIAAKLRDPVLVHAAMLRGEIATPAIRDMLHVYGADALARWDAALPAPAGWRLVPVEPTYHMLRESLISAAEAARYYSRMLAAAPAAPGGAQ